jgi:predicted MPP superfamily phosphohydrolase
VHRVLPVLSFGVLALAVLSGLHVYAWKRLVRDVGMPRPWRRGASVVVILMALLVPIVFLLGRRIDPARETGAAFFAYVWLGMLFYLVLWLGTLDALRLLGRLARWTFRRDRTRRDRTRRDRAGRDRTEVVDEGRRLFLRRVAASSAIAGSGTIAVLGHREAGEILTPVIEVKLPHLPRELSGFGIAQLSDLHIGPLLREGFLESVVEKTNALAPDLVVITGDLVDAPVARLARVLAPLERLRARCGVAFVTGNHEYYCGAREWVEFLRSRGIRVLMNERIAVGDRSAAGATFDLAGVPDYNGGRFSADHEPDLELALADRDPERALVLLAHQPRQIALTRGRGVGLQLSGHTHGGQLWPFGALVALYQPWVAGFHRADDGTQIYVSRGTGFWGPPMRVGNPPEIASIVLTA